MRGFFPKSELLAVQKPQGLIPECGRCGLYKTCKSPKMPYSGKGQRRILIVAEAPGAEEDERGIQLCGPSGQLLESNLKRIGINMRKDCWLTNALICRPPNNEIKDKKAISYCRPNLTKTIQDLDPEVIIPLGGISIRSLFGAFWKEGDIGGISRWAGWQIPSQKLNAWICPTYHPAYLKRSNDEVLDRIFLRHLKAAVAHKDRPWPDGPPDYPSQVEKVLDADEAAAILRKMIRKGGTVAFDYETNMLKPDWHDAEIVCCAVCWEGKKTIAYPWRGEAIKATGELLQSEVYKVASNLKFEDRWSRMTFGKPVRNWVWDTTLGAHFLDNREQITGLKFQAFALLGTPSYNDWIEPFLKTKGSDRVNKVLKEIETGRLLFYCGMDALLEFQVAKIQMEKVHGRETRAKV